MKRLCILEWKTFFFFFNKSNSHNFILSVQAKNQSIVWLAASFFILFQKPEFQNQYLSRRIKVAI